MKCNYCFLWIACLLFFSCQQKKGKSKPEEKAIPAASTLPHTNYDFTTPDSVWELPDELLELSGICFNKEGKMLCHEDQNGIIYTYNLRSKTIETATEFAGKGDCEDIAYHNDTVYILRTDGIIFQVADYLTSPKTTEISTNLGRDNNPEGLCYDQSNNRLLIACKEYSGIPDADKRTKAVYALSLNDKKLQEKPVYTLSRENLAKAFGSEIEIYPSSIAVHPISKNIFVIGTRAGRVIAELLPDGTILHVNRLTNHLFIQPEGITFSNNGDMYIANEGKNEAANILLFKYKK